MATAESPNLSTESRRFSEIIFGLFWRFLRVMGGIRHFEFERPYFAPPVLSTAEFSKQQSDLLASLITATKPPEPPAINVPKIDFSPLQSAANAIASLPERKLAYQEAAARLPTELAQQQIAQNYLKTLQSAVDKNGNPLNLGNYVTTVGSGGQVQIGPYPYNTSTAAIDLGLNPLRSNTVQTQQQTTQQTQQTTQQQAANNAQAPAIPKPSVDVYGDVVNPIQQATPDVPSTTQPTQTVPVAASGKDVFDAYKQRISGDAKSWYAEIGPDGTPTGRTIIRHDPKSGLADQPIHPAWSSQNLGLGSTQAHPGLATAAPSTTAQPVTSPTPVARPSNVSPLLAMTMGQAPANWASSPQATTAAIQQVGGPAWAGTANAPQAPLPAQNVPADHILLGPPGTLPQTTSRIPAPPTATPSETPRFGHLPSDNPNHIQETYGMSAQEALARFQNGVSLGRDTAIPYLDNSYDPQKVGQPAEVIQMTDSNGNPMTDVRGKPIIGYVDPAGGGAVTLGTVYTKKADNGYLEHREYLDGKSADVPNVIKEAQDKAMMAMVVKNGYATPEQYDKWGYDQKVGAYRLAAAQENTTSNEGVNKALAERQAILDAGLQLKQSIQALSTPQDPDGVHARNALALAWNARLNQFGSIIGVKDNPALSKAQSAYTNFLNTVRDAETHRPAQSAEKLGIGIKSEGFDVGAIGNLSDQSFMPNLQTYLANQGRFFSRDVDYALASKFRIPVQTVYSANLAHQQGNAVGASEQNPFLNITSRALYDKLPDWSYYVVPGHPPYQKKPGN